MRGCAVGRSAKQVEAPERCIRSPCEARNSILMLFTPKSNASIMKYKNNNINSALVYTYKFRHLANVANE